MKESKALLNELAKHSGPSTDCQTTTCVECVTFSWKIDNFCTLRRLAEAEALPHGDRLVSDRFGNALSGVWHVVVYPFGEVEWRRHVSVFLHSENDENRLANFSIVVLDGAGNEMSRTKETLTFTFSKFTNNWGYPDFLTSRRDSDLRPFIFNGALSIRIGLQVLTVSTHNLNPCPTEATNIGAELTDFMRTTDISDLRLVCGNQHFEANRLVLAARSKVFRTMLFGDYKDVNEIIIEDVPEYIMSNVLLFCMNDDCDIFHSESDNPSDEVASLLEAAKKYEIKALKDACIVLLKRAFGFQCSPVNLSKLSANCYRRGMGFKYPASLFDLNTKIRLSLIRTSVAFKSLRRNNEYVSVKIDN